jgi:membrane protein
MRFLSKVKIFYKILKESFGELMRNDPLRLSSSTAFFATFSLVPILIIIFNLFGIIFNEELITGDVFERLERMLGEKSASQLRDIMLNVQDIRVDWYITIGIFIFLLFIATTLFLVVHNSFDQIWMVKPKEGRRFKFMLKNRGVSVVIILITGVLFMITFTADIVVTFLGDYLVETLPYFNKITVRVLNYIASLLVFTVWFACVYKFLPDVKLKWKPVWIGALLTAVLFLIGQFLIGELLLAGDITSIYGASGSIVLLLLFIFYSSFILYYGMMFIKKLSEHMGIKIKVKKFTVRYEIRELNGGY